MMEVKYIIVKNKQGKWNHFKSDSLHHGTIARDNGYSEEDIFESGIFLDGQKIIMECQDKNHLRKRKENYVGDRLNYYQDMRLRQWLKGRELESSLYYSKRPVGLREGD